MCAPVGNELSAASAPMHTIHYEEPHHQSTCISFLLQLSACFTKSLLVQRKKLSKGLERTYWTIDWKWKVQLLQAFGFLLKSYYLWKANNYYNYKDFWFDTSPFFRFFLEICRKRETSAASQRPGGASNDNLDLVKWDCSPEVKVQ